MDHDQKEKTLPSNMECVAKEDDTHKSSNSDTQGLEHGDKQRPFLMYAPRYYTKCHHTSKNSLQNEKLLNKMF